MHGTMPDDAAFQVQTDPAALAQFADALFRYAEPHTYASLRMFDDDDSKGPAVRALGVQIGDSLAALTAAAVDLAADAAASPRPLVFCPPVATFANPERATEEALANGLALSVECDSGAQAARAQLEALLGPATVVVASGGEWLRNAETGELSPKLHLHWRLTEPTRTREDHGTLKLARVLAARLVKADPSNTPIVHPIRWPGSVHRKRAPKLARIVALTSHEIDLVEALERLREAVAVAGLADAPGRPGAPFEGTGDARETAELVRAVLDGDDYHGALTALAMRFLKGGMADGQAVNLLRGLMLAVPETRRDLKDGMAQAGRWQARINDIPRAVATARAKIGERPAAADKEHPDGGAWPDPIDFLGDMELTGVPKLEARHLPAALAPFVFDTAARMGADPAAVALAAIVACGSVTSDEWQVQPKVHDDTWTEAPRLWGAIVGDPSILKTPVLKACTHPIDILEAKARARHAEEMRAYRAELAALKADKTNTAAAPPKPRCDRFMVEGTTSEALSEVLRDDEESSFRAPAHKVLVRADEMSGWLGDMDRYKAGGKGGGDRAAYLTLFNGGRYTVDRIGRGSFAVTNWSGCVLGGIQPEPIQRIAKDAADDGLLQRFLYCVPAAQEAGEDRRPDHVALARYEALFPALAVLRPASGFPGAKPRAVVLSEGAHRHRLDIDELLRVYGALDLSTRQKAALGKMRGIFARLALTFHVIALADANASGINPGPVAAVLSEETAGKAAAYMQDILLPHLIRAEAVLFNTPQTSHAHWVAGYVLASVDARDNGRVTLRDVTRAYKPLRPPERRAELLEVMETLEVMAWLTPEPTSNPSRKTAAWQVNPKLHTTFAVQGAAERERRRKAKAEATELIRRKTAKGTR
jgi:hypothetical protein